MAVSNFVAGDKSITYHQRYTYNCYEGWVSINIKSFKIAIIHR